MVAAVIIIIYTILNPENSNYEEKVKRLKRAFNVKYLVNRKWQTRLRDPDQATLMEVKREQHQKESPLKVRGVQGP